MDNHVDHRERRTVYYDDECETCEKAARKIVADIDLSVVGVSEGTPRFVSREELLQDIHAMDELGVMHRGYDAVLMILRWHPQGRFIAPILGLPGLKQAGAGMYRLVTRKRRRQSSEKF